jgi:hypothetical protein
MYTFVMGFTDIEDAQRLSVLRAFLARADLSTPQTALALFGELRKRAQDAPSLRASFDALTAALGGKAVKSVLVDVVDSMRQLEKATAAKEGGDAFARSGRGLPTAWVRFCAPTDAAEVAGIAAGSPVSALLRSTLLATETPATLQALCAQFGRDLFWHVFAVVLKGTPADVLSQDGATPSEKAPSPLGAVLAQLQMAQVMPAVAEEEKGALGAKTASVAPAPSSYFAQEADIKDRSMGKDMGARESVSPPLTHNYPSTTTTT